MNSKNALCALMAVTFFPMCLTTTRAQSLDLKEFQELHAALEPGDEDWKSIPWQTDLLQAQQLAAESQKPIFIWAMDGHPLGCT